LSLLFCNAPKQHGLFQILEQTPKDQAVARRDRGMAKASGHAESVSAHWNDDADRALRVFLRARDGGFLAEDFVAWTRWNRDIVQPPDGRAWGAVLNRAARAGLIRKLGYAPANTSNRSPKCLWVRA
jgi:hypothetical protein